MIRAHLQVTGIVQGVGFRYHTEKHARAESLTGYVRNCLDGTVEVEVQGNEAVVNGFIQWLYKGVPRSHVRSVEQQFIPVVVDEDEFQVQF